MSPIRMERIESAMRISMAFNEAFNRHDVNGMVKLLTEDCIFESIGPAPDGETYKGKESITQYWQEFFQNSPKAHLEIEEVFGMGRRCLTRWRYEWEDEDGKKQYVRGADIFQEKDGLLCEQFSYVKG